MTHPRTRTAQPIYAEAVAEIGQQRVHFTLLVPLTEAARTRGLQGFQLGPTEGMLFPSRVFPGPEPISMWMASVGFPITMLWIGRWGRLVAKETPALGDVRSYTHTGVGVIELHAAAAKVLSIGDVVRLARR